jgi:hypothetical protein
MRRILDLAAPGAGQVAAEEWFQHQDQRVLLPSGKTLAEHISRNGPHLTDRNAHLGEISNFLRS